jgi:hypothetical protein
MDDLQSCILKHWVHSHEEDGDGVTVYRPSGYAFPPSRGRRGLEFRKGGELVYHGIARADGSEPLSGKWSMEGSDRLRITVDSPRVEPFVLQVVSCDGQTLKVRST